MFTQKKHAYVFFHGWLRFFDGWLWFFSPLVMVSKTNKKSLGKPTVTTTHLLSIKCGDSWFR